LRKIKYDKLGKKRAKGGEEQDKDHHDHKADAGFLMCLEFKVALVQHTPPHQACLVQEKDARVKYKHECQAD